MMRTPLLPLRTKSRTLAASWCVQPPYTHHLSGFSSFLDHTQSVIKASSQKPKKEKKKGKKQTLDYDDGGDDDALAEEDKENANSKAPVEMTAEELADEEWGSTEKKGKKKKDKKGKKVKAADEDDDFLGMPSPISFTTDSLADYGLLVLPQMRRYLLLRQLPRSLR
jgi:hypothetical protein